MKKQFIKNIHVLSYGIISQNMKKQFFDINNCFFLLIITRVNALRFLKSKTFIIKKK